MSCLVIGIVLFLLLITFSVSPVFGIFVLVGIIGVSYYISMKEEDKKIEESHAKSNRIYEVTRSLVDFKITQRLTSFDKEMSLFLDEESKKLCIIVTSTQSKEIYSYSDILESEIIEDGITVLNTSRSSQFGGALLGGILAGGVGALIGGLSAKQTSTNDINRIDLKIVVNNTKNPYKLINIITADVKDFNGKPYPIKKEDIKYKDAMNTANHWHSLISILIKQADIEDNKNKIQQKSNDVVGSLADEIKKLSNLYKEGILTEEEYNIQKQRLLSN